MPEREREKGMENQRVGGWLQESTVGDRKRPRIGGAKYRKRDIESKKTDMITP